MRYGVYLEVCKFESLKKKSDKLNPWKKGQNLLWKTSMKLKPMETIDETHERIDNSNQKNDEHHRENRWKNIKNMVTAPVKVRRFQRF
jgi:hypothetical protein